MFSIFKTHDKPYEKEAIQLYTMAMNRARHPYFFDILGVPDTMDGRFEMLALHVFLIMNRLLEAEDEERGKEASQALFDVMFADMDQSLRQVGLGDMTVPKRMRFLMKGFNGRSHIYAEALKQKTDDSLMAALSKNVYEGEAEKDKLEKLTAYIRGCHKGLEKQSVEPILSGSVNFGEL
jgi:cytochrome b pre-mRNA-processing protein 3